MHRIFPNTSNQMTSKTNELDNELIHEECLRLLVGLDAVKKLRNSTIETRGFGEGLLQQMRVVISRMETAIQERATVIAETVSIANLAQEAIRELDELSEGLDQALSDDDEQAEDEEPSSSCRI